MSPDNKFFSPQDGDNNGKIFRPKWENLSSVAAVVGAKQGINIDRVLFFYFSNLCSHKPLRTMTPSLFLVWHTGCSLLAEKSLMFEFEGK